MSFDRDKAVDQAFKKFDPEEAFGRIEMEGWVDQMAHQIKEKKPEVEILEMIFDLEDRIVFGLDDGSSATFLHLASVPCFSPDSNGHTPHH